MKDLSAKLRCIRGCATYDLSQVAYQCHLCGSLLEVVHDLNQLKRTDASAWKNLFASRTLMAPGPYGSGVWRYHEWVLPTVPANEIVTLGEGGTPLVTTPRLADAFGVDLLVKQCGQSLSGSFKDLGMTVLVSHVHHLKRQGIPIQAVVCASTGDTSAALAAYGAAGGIRTLVLLPRGKVSAAQLVQPLCHGARVVAIETDFDGCMRHVQRLAKEEGIYLANSKNSLRVEGQKTVAFEIVEGLGWKPPAWIAVPGGNLGNVSALAAGLELLVELGLIDRLPRLLCAQTARADPLYRAYLNGFPALEPVVAGATQASAIRIGNPVSYAKAVSAVQQTHGVVASISEQELVAAARQADKAGLYVCPHTAVALAAVAQLRSEGTIAAGDRVVVVGTAHGLKFTEFKQASAANQVPDAKLEGAQAPVFVPDAYEQVRLAALGP